MLVSEKLQAVGEMLFVFENWTQGAHHRGASGEVLLFGDSGICQNCLIGAVRHVEGHEDVLTTSTIRYLSEALRKRLNFGLNKMVRLSLATYNDSEKVTHRDILSLVHHAKIDALLDEENIKKKIL